MELKARGSEKRHIPARGVSNSNGAIAMTSWQTAACRGERTDDDELSRGKRLIFGVERHGGGGVGGQSAEGEEVCLGEKKGGWQSGFLVFAVGSRWERRPTAYQR
jgi:hypothetical protein